MTDLHRCECGSVPTTLFVNQLRLNSWGVMLTCHKCHQWSIALDDFYYELSSDVLKEEYSDNIGECCNIDELGESLREVFANAWNNAFKIKEDA